jgi:membrane-bound serine protease (ClpP class)
MSRLVALLLAASATLFVGAQSPEEIAPGPALKRPLVLTCRLDDQPITRGVDRYFRRAIREAEDRGAECLVIMLDTPGGLLESTRSIVKEMLATRTCVVVYVFPPGGRAASAGVFITLASHVAAMAPGTTIGAAHPVQVGGLPLAPPSQEPPSLPGKESGRESGKDEDEDKGSGKDEDMKQKTEESEPRPEASPRPESLNPKTPMEEKILNDTVSWARALATLRHRNADWAARAVKESISVTADEALREKVVDLEADNLDDLLKKLDGREVSLLQGPRKLSTAGAEVEEIPMGWGEGVLGILSEPTVAFLLLMFGFYGVLFELHSPGWGVGGTLGVICLLLAMFGLSLLPVNYLGLVLILVSLLLFAAEVFVTSFGALTLAGIACLVLGGLMLVDSPVGFSRVSPLAVVPVAVATGLIVVFLLGNVVRTHRRRPQTGDQGLIGSQVEACDDFARRGERYAGTVFVHGEWWKATSDAPVAAGQACRVEDRRGLLLAVKPLRTAVSET